MAPRSTAGPKFQGLKCRRQAAIPQRTLGPWSSIIDGEADMLINGTGNLGNKEGRDVALGAVGGGSAFTGAARDEGVSTGVENTSAGGGNGVECDGVVVDSEQGSVFDRFLSIALRSKARALVAVVGRLAGAYEQVNVASMAARWVNIPVQ